MALKAAKCPNCGGSLQADSTKKAAICPYCNGAYVVEDAINYYMTSIENFHADLVNFHDDRAANARLEAGEAFLKLQHWDKADEAFHEVCDLTPQNYMGWWGRIRALSHDFSIPYHLIQGPEMYYIHQSEQYLQQLMDLFFSVEMFAPEEEKAALSSTFNSYTNPIILAINTYKDYNTQCNQRLQQLINETTEKHNMASNLYDMYKNKRRRNTDRIFTLWNRGMGTFMAFLVISCIIWVIINIHPVPCAILGLIIVITIIAAIMDKRGKIINFEDSNAENEYRKQMYEYQVLLEIQGLARDALNRTVSPPDNQSSFNRDDQKRKSVLKQLQEIKDYVLQNRG